MLKILLHSYTLRQQSWTPCANGASFEILGQPL